MSHTLYLSVLIAGGSIEGDDRTGTVTGRIILVHNGTAGKDMPHRITGQGNRKMFPMNQVTAYGMPPMHISPYRTVRIILKVKMIFAILINQSVRIIHPTIQRSMVIKRTEFITVGRIERVGEFHLFPAYGILRRFADTDNRLFCSGRQFERDEIIRFLFSQTDIHIRIRRIPRHKTHLPFTGMFFHRQQEVFGRIRNMDKR